METRAVHPALYSWREELPAAFVRGLAILCGLAVLSVFCEWIFQSPQAIKSINPVYQSEWTEVERPFHAFTLAIPEAADAPAGYSIHRNVRGGGRKDRLTLGIPDGKAPYLAVEIYRPGSEIRTFEKAGAVLSAQAAQDAPGAPLHDEEPLDSKFGPLAVAAYDSVGGVRLHCLSFVRAFDDPRLQISGRFCNGGEAAIDRSTLACAIDRLTLLSAGSEPKVGALFAKAELNRSFCGQRDPIIAATPKYRLLWKALEKRPEPRRIGR